MEWFTSVSRVLLQMSRLYVIFFAFLSIFSVIIFSHSMLTTAEKEINANHMLFLPFYFRFKATSFLFLTHCKIFTISLMSCHIVFRFAHRSIFIRFHHFHHILSWNTFCEHFLHLLCAGWWICVETMSFISHFCKKARRKTIFSDDNQLESILKSFPLTQKIILFQLVLHYYQ